MFEKVGIPDACDNFRTSFLGIMKKMALFCQKKTPERYSPGEIQLHLSTILITRYNGYII